MAIEWRSIKFGLSGVFLLFLVLMLILGAFAIDELRAVNQVSAEIRERWLQSTRVLGDLNNFTSDARAGEASRLLAHGAIQRRAVDQQLEELNRQVGRAQIAYQRIPHDPDEIALYQRFTQAWRVYEVVADRVLTLSRQNHDAEAAGLYMSTSLRSYNRASDALGVLTDHTVVRARQASYQAQATYDTARALIATVIVVAGLSLVAAVRYIARFISGPLVVLAQRMRSLAANDTNIEIEGAGRRDEIGEMARAVVVFRNNAVELAHSRLGLVQQTKMLEERLDAEQKLTTLQRNFVSMASHEFRTPLTIIDGHAQRLIALCDRLPPREIAERASRVRSAVQRTTHVIERLLHSSRLFDDPAGLYFHPTSFDPATLLREVCQLHREISPEAHIAEDLRGLPPTMIGDPKLLYQAFSNLLSNAIKYSPDAGLVELAAFAEGDQIVVTVRDQGMGIPEQDRGRVFERYYRGNNVTDIVGTGVGLYLVLMVIELHGGRISVESEEGVSSCFTIRLLSARSDKRSSAGFSR
jgi:two-component system OmpR family sensor kinase